MKALRAITKHRLGAGSLVVFMIVALATIFAPFISPYPPGQTNLFNTFEVSSPEHWMGTDEVGRDVFTRILYGGRVTLIIGVAVGILSALLGTTIGLISGYFGGRIDMLLMRFLDFFLSIPTLALLLVLAVIFRPNVLNLVIILTLLGWTGTARLARSLTLTLREVEYTQAAHAAGASTFRIMARHILRNAMAPLIVATTLSMANAITAESALSYLGLGIQPPTPSWGNMLMNAQEYFWRMPSLAVLPGIFIFIAVLSLNFIGDAIRDTLDPRLKL
ncbi:MAG: ABC transporter permease [Thermaerobacterales bacterium]